MERPASTFRSSLVPHEVFDIPLTSYSAALLLGRSSTMVLALARPAAEPGSARDPLALRDRDAGAALSC